MPLFGSDIELVHALQRKESTAYSAIFDLYARPLIYFVEKMTKNTQVAQDIATESFLKTFERSEQFETLPKLKSFLFTVGNNAALDWLKTEKRRNIHLEDYTIEEAVNLTEKRVIDAEIVQAVYNEIEQLPAQVKAVVKLSIIEGWSIQEIADHMGIAYKTVQNHKTRGYNIIRAKLLNDYLLSLPLLYILFALQADHGLGFPRL